MSDGVDTMFIGRIAFCRFHFKWFAIHSKHGEKRAGKATKQQTESQHSNHKCRRPFYNLRTICNTLHKTTHVARKGENERVCDAGSAQGLLRGAKQQCLCFPIRF